MGCHTFTALSYQGSGHCLFHLPSVRGLALLGRLRARYWPMSLGCAATAAADAASEALKLRLLLIGLAFGAEWTKRTLNKIF